MKKEVKKKNPFNKDKVNDHTHLFQNTTILKLY